MHQNNRLSNAYRVLLFMFLVSSFFLKTQAMPPDSIQVTLTEGTNIAMALSPDHSTLVMDLQGTLWTLPFGGGKAKAITDGLGDCRQPSWSPDGRQIAFQAYWDGNFHIWTVGKDGGNLQQITTGAYDEREPFWSPDGKSIVFSSDRSGNYDIWQLTLADGTLKQVTTDPANEYQPAYTADGTKLIYVSERDAAPGLYVQDVNGRETLMMGSKEKLAAPAWNPDGTAIIYQTSLPGQVFLKRFDLKQQTEQILSAKAEDVFPFRVSWLSTTDYLYTADGKIKKGGTIKGIIPFEVRVSLERHVYPSKKRDFNSVAALPVKGIRSPQVSPDGKSIVFTALGDLWLLTKGNPTPKQLTDDAYIDMDASWSPDSKQVIYCSDKAGNMDLWLKDIMTGKEHRVLDQPEAVAFPSWSPDGNNIAYYQEGASSYGQSRLEALDLKTGNVSVLVDALFNSGLPTWSPDGKTLAIAAFEPYSTRFREGISKFLIISKETGTKQFSSPQANVSLATRSINGPVWSPDGTKLAYILDGFLWIVPVNSLGQFTGNPKRLVNELAEAPSWTGDSQSLVFLATDTLKQVFLSDGHIETIPMRFTWKMKQPQVVQIIHAGKVFDGRSNQYLENVDIVIQGNRIREIAPHKAGRSGKWIDASRKTVIPGLFEMHTHQSAAAGEQLGRLWLAYGITSIREPGTDPYDALERKESWDSGRRIGPRTFFTGGLLDGNRIYYGLATSTQSGAQVDMELKRALRLGYDFIKTYVRMPDPMQKRITAFAHQHGIPVSSHEIYPAMSYGVDAVEHMGATSRRGYSPKLTALNHSYQDVIELLVKSKMNITPTASLHGGMYKLVLQDSSFLTHPQFKTFYAEKGKAAIRAGAERMIRTNPMFIESYANVQKTVRNILAAGGRVTPGTDSPLIPPAVSLHAELQTWVDAGISPFETLRSATLWSAEALGLGKDLGSLEPGKLADLVIVDGDPLNQIKDILKIRQVMKNGELHTLLDLLGTSPKTGSTYRGFGYRFACPNCTLSAAGW
ncbi:MAG: amidohydrolase family protein [Siphonobacter sp.]